MRLAVTLLHCGNFNIANRNDRSQKSLFFMPMGLFPLASELKRQGVDVEIVHTDIEAYSGDENVVAFEKLDAIGFDCHWANQSLGVIQTAAMAKARNPRLFVFLGGYTASYFASEIVSTCPAVDAVIRGDGEVAIVELCKALDQGKADGRCPALESVPNLVWRDADREVRVNRDSHVACSESLSGLNYADVTLLRNWQFYRDFCRHWSRFPEANSQNLFFLEVGRGCRYSCTFCGGSAPAQHTISGRRGMALRSVASVVATIRQARQHGYSMFYTCYEDVGISEEWFIDLFQRIGTEEPGISFAYGAWKLPSERLIDVVSGSCKQVMFEMSPESSNEGLRKKNKDQRLFYTNVELEQRLQYIGSKPNCRAQVYFGYFLPFDTIQTVEETMRYVSRLDRQYAEFAEVKYSNFSTDPASRLFADPERFEMGIEVRSFADYLKALERHYAAADARPDMTVFWPRSMTKDGAERIAKMIRGEDLIRPSRLNLSSRVSEILADRRGRAILGRHFKGRMLKQGRQLGRLSVLQVAETFAGELDRERLRTLSEELEGAS